MSHSVCESVVFKYFLRCRKRPSAKCSGRFWAMQMMLLPSASCTDSKNGEVPAEFKVRICCKMTGMEGKRFCMAPGFSTTWLFPWIIQSSGSGGRSIPICREGAVSASFGVSNISSPFFKVAENKTGFNNQPGFNN